MKKWDGTMQSQMKERWLLLCEQAATEQDPTKLMALIEEVNRLLESEENRRREVRGMPRKAETSAEG
jgi:hypothetical protein